MVETSFLTTPCPFFNREPSVQSPVRSSDEHSKGPMFVFTDRRSACSIWHAEAVWTWAPYSKGFPLGPCYGPLPSLKGSELWAPLLNIQYNWYCIGVQIRGTYQGQMGKPLEISGADSWQPFYSNRPRAWQGVRKPAIEGVIRRYYSTRLLWGG